MVALTALWCEVSTIIALSTNTKIMQVSNKLVSSIVYTNASFSDSVSWDGGRFEKGGGALCVQMDFTRTFDANTKCNNINYVWSHFYQILVVLKHHRRLWNNIFDTDISRSINIPKIAKYTPLMLVFMHLKMSVSKILFHRRLWYFRTTKIW